MIDVVESEDDFAANLLRSTVNENQKAYPASIPYISEVTNTGLVIIIFTRALQEISNEIDLKNLKYEAEPGVWKPVLTVELQPAET